MANYTQNTFPVSESPLSDGGNWVSAFSSTGLSTNASGEIKSSTIGWQCSKLNSAVEPFSTVIYAEFTVGNEAGNIGGAVVTDAASGWGGLGVVMNGADSMFIREYYDATDLEIYGQFAEIYPTLNTGSIIAIEITDNVAADTSNFEIYVDDVSVYTGTIGKPDATTLQPAFIGQNDTAGTLTAITARDTKTLAQSITDVDGDNILTDGQTSVVANISGFTTPPDSGKLVSGAFEYALTNFSSNATTATFDIQDIANLSGSQAGVPFSSASHSLTLVLENSVDVESASIAITLNPATGRAVQEVTGVNNAADACVTKNFTGTPPNTSQIDYATANNTSLNAQAQYTSDIINGSIDMRYWDAVTGIWEPFTVTLVDGVIASISRKGKSVRGSVRKAISSSIIDIMR